MFDIADLAASEGFLTRDDFLAAARDPSPILDLAPGAPSLEGFLFPATYEFPRHMTGKDMTAAMVKKFRQEWLALPVAGAALHHSVQNIVTLASLVERETPRPEERPHVAGVFENRLRIGERLQCDPTVTYALTLAGAYTGKLDGADLHFDSPYNTYRNKGLPPGPIANPGKSSLRAAVRPEKTEDLYFVADGSGGHAFSDSYDQHQKNVAKLRTMEKQIQNDTVEPADDPPPPAAAAPADPTPTATTPKPAPAKKPARGGPGRQGAAQSTTTPPVIQQ